MSKLEDGSELPRDDMIQKLQEALPAIEPPPHVREAMLQRILVRTVRNWREWLNRARARLDD